jgi:hypothetical protein
MSRARRAAVGARGLAEQLEELRQLVTRQQEELAAQRALVAKQQEELAAQRADLAGLHAERAESATRAPTSPLIMPAQFRDRVVVVADDAAPERTNGRHTSRRGLLKLGGAAAAATIGAGVLAAKGSPAAHAMPAHADSVTLYESNSGGGNYAIQGDGFGGAVGVWGNADTGGGSGVVATSDGNHALYGESHALGFAGIYGVTTNNGRGVVGDATRTNGIGVLGAAAAGTGVYGTAIGVGVFGETAWAGSASVLGLNHSAGRGVQGSSDSGIDVFAGDGAKGFGLIGQQPWASTGVPGLGLTFGAQLRDANGDMWLGTGLGNRLVATLAPGNKLGGSINLLSAATRLLDTRGGSPVAYHATAQFQAAGVGGIPAGAIAVLGHVAAGPRVGVSCGDGSSAILWPAGQTRPPSVNTVYNNPVDSLGQCLTGTLTLVAIGAGGKISLFSQPINPVGVDYVFDAFGFVM